MMNNPKSRNQDLVVQEFEQEVLIYDLKNNTAYSLNETSASVWRMCDGKTSVKEMSQNLAVQANQPIGDEIIWLALDTLKRNNLLANDEDLKIEFGGLSRREVIKKVGLASMIALPVVASLIAPSAAFALSCGTTSLPPGCVSRTTTLTKANPALPDLNCNSINPFYNNFCNAPACLSGMSTITTCTQITPLISATIVCTCS